MTNFQNPYQFNKLSHDVLSSKSDIIIKGLTATPGRQELVVSYYDNVTASYQDGRIDIPRNLSRNGIQANFTEPMSLEFNHCALKGGQYEWECSATPLPQGYTQANYGTDDINDYKGGLNAALVTGQEDVASVTFTDVYSDGGNNYDDNSLNSLLLG